MNGLDDLRVYSATPWELDRTRGYEQPTRHKPRGLWVSVGDDWERWCRDDDWGYPEGHQYVTQITVDRDANLLIITNNGELDKFTRWLTSDSDPYRLDWSIVAAHYSGIVIAPYLWERRLHDATSWYYSWDCASGCIWNLDTIITSECRVVEAAS